MKAKQIINMRSIIKYQLALLLLIAGLFVNTSMAGSGSPEEVVVKMQSSLIQVMKDGEKLGYNGRVKFLEPVIDQSHDMELIIKTILGATYWSQLDNSQKKLIINTFRELSVSTYASRFTQYQGDQFEVVGGGSGSMPPISHYYPNATQAGVLHPQCSWVSPRGAIPISFRSLRVAQPQALSTY